MRKDLLTAVAGLLHDIGKVVRRTGNKNSHSIAGEEYLKEKGFPTEIINATRLIENEFMNLHSNMVGLDTSKWSSTHYKTKNLHSNMVGLDTNALPSSCSE